MSDLTHIRNRIESRIRVLSRPDGNHVYNKVGIHADIDKCGECGRLWELQDLLHWFEGIDADPAPTRTAVEAVWLLPIRDIDNNPTWICRACNVVGAHQSGCNVPLTLAVIDHYPGPSVEFVTPEVNRVRA